MRHQSLIGFYAARHREYACPCGWRGSGRETALGDIESLWFHRFGITDLHCPECDDEVGSVWLCDPDDVLAHRDEADAATVALAEAMRRALAEWSRRHLARPEQLPDLDGDGHVASWDLAEVDGLEHYVVRVAERELWREVALFPGSSWRGPDRFAQVAAVLRQKYGERLRDLVPTPAQIEAWSFPEWHDLGRLRGREAIEQELRQIRRAVLGSRAARGPGEADG